MKELKYKYTIWSKATKTLVVIICTSIIVWFLIFNCFFDIAHFVGQDIISVLDSPDGNYEIVVYRNNGGATVNYTLLCAIRSTTTGKEKNIYWEYPYQEPVIQWDSKYVVIINGHKLNIKKDTYDYRRKR